MPMPRRVVEQPDIRICFTLKIDRDQADYELIVEAMKELGYKTDLIRNPDAAEVARILMRKGNELWLEPMKKERLKKKE
jgi:hypothetical protein